MLEPLGNVLVNFRKPSWNVSRLKIFIARVVTLLIGLSKNITYDHLYLFYAAFVS